MCAHKTTCRDATGPKRNTSHCTAPALFPWKWRVHFRDSSEETWHGLQPLCWRCVFSRCHWVPLMPDTMVTCHLKVTSSSPSLVWNDAFPATCPATHSSCYPGNHPTLIHIDAKSSTRATGCLIFSSPLKWLPTWFTHIRTLFLIFDCSNLTSCFVFMFYPLSHWWLFPPSSELSVLQASVTHGFRAPPTWGLGSAGSCHPPPWGPASEHTASPLFAIKPWLLEYDSRLHIFSFGFVYSLLLL